MTDDTFARSVAWWLRAYPRRWRTARAAEVTDLLADLAAPGTRRLDLRSGLGLVRAGWATRWREHPPPLAWLGYALFERRLAPRYRDWVADDIAGSMYQARRMLVGAAIPMAFVLVPALGGAGLPDSFFAIVVPVVLLATGLWSRRQVDRAISLHLTLQPGDVVTPAARIHALVSRPRVAARSALTAGVAVAASALALGLLLVAVAPARLSLERDGVAGVSVTSAPISTPARAAALLAVVLAAAVGLLLARAATARLHRWQPEPQPARVVVPLDGHGWWRVGATTAALAAMLVLWPGGVTAGALPLALGAAVLLPVLVAARRAVVTGRTRAVAAVEVRRAVLGRPDPADHPVAGYLPATAWLPAGTIAPPPEPPALRSGDDPYRA